MPWREHEKKQCRMRMFTGYQITVGHLPGLNLAVRSKIIEGYSGSHARYAIALPCNIAPCLERVAIWPHAALFSLNVTPAMHPLKANPKITHIKNPEIEETRPQQRRRRAGSRPARAHPWPFHRQKFLADAASPRSPLQWLR